MTGRTIQGWRDVYYISGNTGILAKDLGKALLCQFPQVRFNEELIPFIRTESQARKALGRILSRSAGRHPIIFSTLFDRRLNAIFTTDGVEFLNICEHFLGRLEATLHTEPTRQPGSSRILDDSAMTRRVNAIHYAITHDDGTATGDYDEADIILVGVSRCGKTPVAIFLATHMGLKAANYPLVDGDLHSCQLPSAIVDNTARVVGLSSTPEMLHSFRQQRYAGSTYAQISTCTTELKQSALIFQTYQLPVVFSNGRSIEETATQVVQMLRLQKAVARRR
ncbi:MAG: pyruvate, water dikinase regulatory protein [Desulfopila sp.]